MISYIRIFIRGFHKEKRLLMGCGNCLDSVALDSITSTVGHDSGQLSSLSKDLMDNLHSENTNTQGRAAEQVAEIVLGIFDLSLTIGNSIGRIHGERGVDLTASSPARGVMAVEVKSSRVNSYRLEKGVYKDDDNPNGVTQASTGWMSKVGVPDPVHTTVMKVEVDCKEDRVQVLVMTDYNAENWVSLTDGFVSLEHF